MFDPGLCRRQLVFDGEQSRDDALDIAVHWHRRKIESDRSYGRGGIVANARQSTQRIQIFREVSAVPLYTDFRASVQIASAGVISEAGPGAQHIVQAGRRQ